MPPPPYEGDGVESKQVQDAGEDHRLAELLTRPNHQVRLQCRDFGRRQDSHRRRQQRPICRSRRGPSGDPRNRAGSSPLISTSVPTVARARTPTFGRIDAGRSVRGDEAEQLASGERAIGRVSEHRRERTFECAGIPHRVQVDDLTGSSRRLACVERADPAEVGERDREDGDERCRAQQRVGKADVPSCAGLAARPVRPPAYK